MDELPALGTRVRVRIDEDDCSPEHFARFDGLRGTVVCHRGWEAHYRVSVLPDPEWVISSQYLYLPIDFDAEDLVPEGADTRHVTECESCGRSFKARAGARYCSGACRVRAHRAGVNRVIHAVNSPGQTTFAKPC